MTPTLAHPSAEDLGRFAEGTLDAAGRAAIVAHIADCDECRIEVVDATEFVEKTPVHSQRRWWMATAASLLLVAGVSGFLYTQFHKPWTKMYNDYGQLKNRPIESRLSDLPFVRRSTMRGGEVEGTDTDIATDIVRGDAVEVTELRGENANTAHARGVAFLFLDQVDEAIPLLQKAVAKDPENPRFLNDLAAALIVAGARQRPTESVSDLPKISMPKELPPLQPLKLGKLHLAVQVCDRVLKIDSRSPDALFNRAKAIEFLGENEGAIKAYERYLTVDSSSGWADEARQKVDLLQSTRTTP